MIANLSLKYCNLFTSFLNHILMISLNFKPFHWKKPVFQENAYGYYKRKKKVILVMG